MKKIKFVLLFFSLLLFFCSLFLLSQEKKVKVIAERANINLEPNINSPIIETVKKGTVLTLFQPGKLREIWYYVFFYSEKRSARVSGFIQASLVEVIDEMPEIIKKEKEEPSEKIKEVVYKSLKKIEIKVDEANIRLMPNFESQVIQKARLGTILQSVGKTGEWYRINLPPDEEGIIISGYVHQSFIEEIVEKVKQEVRPIDAKIYLRDGTLLTARILSEDEQKIHVETSMGKFSLARKDILKIEQIKKEQVARDEKPVKPVITPPIPKKVPEKPTTMELPTKKRKKKLISIYLSGGMGNIDGGDLNGMIRDYNKIYEDYDSYYSPNYNANWKKFKWIQNLKGEIVFNISRFFSFSFGIEYLAKINKGTMTQNYEDSWRANFYGYYCDYSERFNYSSEPEHKLSAVPISFNVYLFLPLGNAIDFFITGGGAYYLGKLEYNEPYQYNDEYVEDYYFNWGGYWDSWQDDYSYNGTYTYDAKRNEIGLHGGAGFDIKISSNISLVAEGSYRYVNFKDWEGRGNESWSWEDTWGWSSETYQNDNESQSESWSGKIWYFEFYNRDIGNRYGRMFLYEESPEPSEWIKNIRPAEINLNGFSIRVGIKISF